MACYTVAVSITYRQKNTTGAGTTTTRTSSCVAAPFSIGLDRSRDGFFLYYNGGDQKLEGSWTNYDLLASSIVSQTACTGCTDPSANNYDCINGACVKASTYNTPGLYATQSNCQVACGTGCSGKCISNADWAQIESLSSQLKSRNCS
jgi:hypothetical protein